MLQSIQESLQLDGLTVTEEHVVLVEAAAAAAAADVSDVREELCPADPLDLLEAELDLVAQAQRRAVAE